MLVDPRRWCTLRAWHRPGAEEELSTWVFPLFPPSRSPQHSSPSGSCSPPEDREESPAQGAPWDSASAWGPPDPASPKQLKQSALGWGCGSELGGGRRLIVKRVDSSLVIIRKNGHASGFVCHLLVRPGDLLELHAELCCGVF